MEWTDEESRAWQVAIETLGSVLDRNGYKRNPPLLPWEILYRNGNIAVFIFPCSGRMLILKRRQAEPLYKGDYLTPEELDNKIKDWSKL